MNIGISYETVPRMLKLCRQLKENTLEISELAQLLEHRDYQVEFARYEGRVNKEEFINFFVNLMSINADEITNMDLKTAYPNYRFMLDNIELYEKECEKLKDFTEDAFLKRAEAALAGLPNGFSFEELNFIFTISIGMSFGWVYETYSHFDVLQLIRNTSFDEFLSVIAHEIHHIGMGKIYSGMNIENLSLEEYFYINFSGEGLAVKYCNNGEGVLTKRIYGSEPNLGMDPFTWKYLNDDFANTFNRFKQDVERLSKGELHSMEQVDAIFRDYWMNAHIEGQSKDEVAKLKHFRMYSFGNDIWGVIHDVFGKEKVFEVVKKPSLFKETYNAAVKLIGKEQYQI